MEIRDFIRENKDYCITFAAIVIICITGAWLVHDNRRNEPIYTDTDSTVADIDRRISSIEQRIDRLQDRVTKAEETVSGTVGAIRDGRENAAAVAEGIAGAEERLDAIIQRQGRITNILAEIEIANRQRTQGAQTAGMAK